VLSAACRYRLVGETVVAALWIGHSYFALYPQDRIAVRRRDVIGIYFPRYNPIPWSTVECRHGNEHLYKYNPYSVTMVLSGQRDVVFDTGRQDWNPCRAYSVNATVMDELGQCGLLLIFSKDDLVSAANNIIFKYQTSNSKKMSSSLWYLIHTHSLRENKITTRLCTVSACFFR